MVTLLPDALQQWWFDRKDRRLTAERVESFAHADVLVISYTKSGRTWLRVLISNMMSQCFGLPENILIDGDNLHRLEAAVPSIFFAPDTAFPYPELGPAEIEARPDQKLIYLVRDPRDVVVSMYFHVRHRAGDRELYRKKIPPEARELGINEFVTDPNFGMMRIIRYFNKWAQEQGRFERAMVLRYEDLAADTDASFAKLIAFIGIEADAVQRRRAIEFASFGSMQKKEKEGYFASDRLGRTRADDARTGKVREGRIGGYRGHLQPETAEALDRMIAGELDPMFGYR